MMHAQYVGSMHRQLISTDDTFLWLSKADLKGETEAAQDQVLQIKYHVKKILQTETDSKCRLSKQFDETAEGIISVSQILTKEQYTQTHDTACAQLHFNICKEIGAT